MANLQKFRTKSVIKWRSFNFLENNLKSSKIPIWGSGLCHNFQNPRFYRRKKIVEFEIADANSPVGTESETRISRGTLAEAQNALLEYLHTTRNLQFMDAENISKNSPKFLDNLLKKVEISESNDVNHSITRFLRYHPINEFEPFFESLGLEPSEYSDLLPLDLMFLSDDIMLLENYQVLCNYGIARNKIGKIYKAGPEIFHHDYGVLVSRIRGYEELGLTQSFLIKIISSSPTILVEDINSAFVEVLEKLKIMGFDHCWIESNLSENECYNWRQILELLRLFKKIGCSEEQLMKLISVNPGLLFECSSKMAFLLVGLLVKFGSTRNDLYSMFLQFPQIKIGNFIWNIWRAYIFLKDIDMEIEEIKKIIRSNPALLGSCALKKSNSLLANLNIGKKRLCKIIIRNPQEMKNWTLGSKVEPLPNSGEDILSLQERIKFLLDLGFENDSKPMKNALKVFRGKGGDLHERFKCFVKAGLDRADVCKIVKTAPQILNQSKEVIEMKIGFLVNDLGFPISSLKNFPGYVSYTIQRVIFRMAMYNWLKDQGTVGRLSLSTIVASSDSRFEKKYLNQYPKGLKRWHELKKQYYQE